MNPINQFSGRYRWLSNFWPSAVEFDCLTFYTVEHAYQAAKSKIHSERLIIQEALLPSTAKRLGKKFALREDWEDIKLDIMEHLLRQKFSDEDFKETLLETGDRELIEGNYWHDQFWGSCYCEKHKNIEGENHLGKLIMKIRKELQCQQK